MIVALDYGEKNIGIALTDEDEVFVFPFEVISTYDFEKDPMIFSKKIPRFALVSEIIIGLPLNLKNQDTLQTTKARTFHQQVSESYPAISVILVDERMTSAQLLKNVHSIGGNSRQLRPKKDMYEAALLLEFYLNRRKNLSEIENS